jgi:hypothetical protein
VKLSRITGEGGGGGGLGEEEEEEEELMRSRAVGIDKQQNGSVNLGNFPVVLNFFKPFIG